MSEVDFYEKMRIESMKSLIMYAIASYTIKTIEDVLNVCPSVEIRLGKKILDKMIESDEVRYNSDMVLTFGE